MTPHRLWENQRTLVSVVRELHPAPTSNASSSTTVQGVINTPFAALTQWVDGNHVTCFRPITLAHLEAIAVVLHRSPAAFLVDSDAAAAIVEQIASSQERCLQVIFFLETLIDQSGEAADATEAPAS